MPDKKSFLNADHWDFNENWSSMYFPGISMFSKGIQHNFIVTKMQKWNSLLVCRLRDLLKICLGFVNTHSHFQMSVPFVSSTVFLFLFSVTVSLSSLVTVALTPVANSKTAVWSFSKTVGSSPCPGILSWESWFWDPVSGHFEREIHHLIVCITIKADDVVQARY